MSAVIETRLILKLAKISDNKIQKSFQSRRNINEKEKTQPMTSLTVTTDYLYSYIPHSKWICFFSLSLEYSIEKKPTQLFQEHLTETSY